MLCGVEVCCLCPPAVRSDTEGHPLAIDHCCKTGWFWVSFLGQRAHDCLLPPELADLYLAHY